MTKKYWGKAGGLLISLLVLALGFLVFTPFLFMFAQSMRMPAEAYKMPPDLFPTRWDLTNYATLLNSDLPLVQMAVNSLTVTLCTIVVRLTVSIMAAYAIAKIRYRGSNAVMIGFLSSIHNSG